MQKLSIIQVFIYFFTSHFILVTYLENSLVIYHTGGKYNRGYEWESKLQRYFSDSFSDQIFSSGRGVPVTVLVQGSTTLDIGALSTTYPLEINQLSIEDGSGITFNSPGHVMSAPLIVDGQFINNGAITLSC